MSARGPDAIRAVNSILARDLESDREKKAAASIAKLERLKKASHRTKYTSKIAAEIISIIEKRGPFDEHWTVSILPYVEETDVSTIAAALRRYIDARRGQSNPVADEQ